MAKKKKGRKKKGKKGKKKKGRVGPAPPYYPVVLTTDYKFGQIIATSIAEKQKNDREAINRVIEGGIRISLPEEMPAGKERRSRARCHVQTQSRR